jgi:hypothetical protein
VLYRFLDVHKPTLSQVKSPTIVIDKRIAIERREEADWVKLRGEPEEAERLNKSPLQ